MNQFALFSACLMAAAVLPAATLMPSTNPQLSGWTANEGATLSFAALPEVGGVTGFKAFGQATNPTRLNLGFCSWAAIGNGCIPGEELTPTPTGVPWGSYNGETLLFRLKMTIDVPNRPDDTFGFLLNFRPDINGTTNIFQQAPTTQRTFDLTNTFTMPTVVMNEGGFMPSYNWFLQLTIFVADQPGFDPNGDPYVYTVTIPNDSIDITGQGVPTGAAIPEPGTWSMLVGAGVLAGAWRRWRRVGR
jgi:hypothetical protein